MSWKCVVVDSLSVVCNLVTIQHCHCAHLPFSKWIRCGVRSWQCMHPQQLERFGSKIPACGVDVEHIVIPSLHPGKIESTRSFLCSQWTLYQYHKYICTVRHDAYSIVCLTCSNCSSGWVENDAYSDYASSYLSLWWYLFIDVLLGVMQKSNKHDIPSFL